MFRHSVALIRTGVLLFSLVQVHVGLAKHVNQEKANVELRVFTMVARLVFSPSFCYR